MKRNAMRRNLTQSIRRSFGRYLAISLIIALGGSLFVGLLATKTDMVATGQKFMDEQDMFDLRMVGNYGWTEKYVDGFSRLPGVTAAEGVYSVDLIASNGQGTEESVYRFYAIPDQVDRVALRGGRMPENNGECLVDGFHKDDSVLGKRITISQNNDPDSLDKLKGDTFTVVGYVAAPLYMDMNRGTTSVGSGSLSDCYYLPKADLNNEYYTEIHLRLSGDYPIYTQEYNDFLDDAADRLKPRAEELCRERFQDIRQEAEDEYDEAYQEYQDGVKEYEGGKAKAEKELADAEKELKDGEQELADNRKKLLDAQVEIDEGKKQIKEARGKLAANRKTLTEQQAALQPAYKQADDGKDDAQQAVNQLSARMEDYRQKIAGIDEKIKKLQKEQEDSAETENPVDHSTDITKLGDQRTKAVTERDELSPKYEEASAKLAGINQVIAGMKAIEDGLAQVDAGEKEVRNNEVKIHNAENKLMIGWGKWKQGKKELEDGWKDYEQAKLDTQKELDDAKAELTEAEEKLKDARDEIDAMDKPELLILDRRSNVGYNNLDSNSDIVAGVSRVFPVFFILIAALVCITTMTRMIEEERTQIGTLKALGYTDREIMGKYLIYSGSGAVLGCALGVAAGSTVFPKILWKAYCIMLNIQPDVILKFNWPLALAVLLVYTTVMLFVTWWCCRKTLRENPAELIRPKAPEAGKQILIERLPIWKHLSFLNKVAIRNIFRYRQRLAMMLIGIGGCTALLLTGFGLRDSISNVVSYQFENVTKYDLSVYFREEPSQRQQEKFREALASTADALTFYHQSSVELDFHDRVKEIYLISGGKDISRFIDFHEGTKPLSMPGKNQVLLSAGVAENLGVKTGDEVILRNGDLKELKVTVSGIYDNHVYNYAIAAPETIEAQWGEKPDYQMAFVSVKPGSDVHAASAAAGGLSFVMNVTVSEDLAANVGRMMEAMDLVVWVIVFCAGLLAVTVLYNLTNININERIREIATIKVLGFNAGETAAYVFKENMALTVVGAALGLLMGKFLLLFVMSQIKIDAVRFTVLAQPISYVWSIALTLLSAVVVDFVFYFKLDKINMAESLKSVE